MQSKITNRIREHKHISRVISGDNSPFYCIYTEYRYNYFIVSLLSTGITILLYLY
jgi:hypothetical protein